MALIVELSVTVIFVSRFQEPHIEVVPSHAKVPPANTMLPGNKCIVFTVELVVNVPPVLIVIVRLGRELPPINELAFEEVALTVMVPPLLILIAVALPKPALELFVPPDIVTACATFIVPVNAWLPLIVTVPLVPFKLIVPVPAAKLVNVCVAELLHVKVAPDETVNADE